MIRPRAMLVTALLMLGGCGYFNSLYNANRSFAIAERASRTGDRTTAAREYRTAIDRAAVSYRRYPDSRWADDALLLLGRARFALGEHAAAAAAMRTLLEQSSDVPMRAVAHAYLGASLFDLEDMTGAASHLDSAAAALRDDTEDRAFTRLWRARTSFERGQTDAGWADLDLALTHRRIAQEAALEGVERAYEQRDSARTFEFMRHLASTRWEGRSLEQVDSMLHGIGREWSPAIAFHSSAPLVQSSWPPQVRDGIELIRAHLALDAGDHETALELATNIGNAVSLGVGSRARRLAGQIRLRRAESLDELEDVRNILLPAYDDRAALDMMRNVRAAQILLHNGEDPASAISLFAAGELLRDVVGAPLLARRVFLDFASRHQSVWAGKAALAAHQIAPTAETAVALQNLSDNPYVRAASGDRYEAADIDRAEERLAFGIDGLRQDAISQAISRDVVLGRAVSVLDSTRTAARNDSVRIACGMLIDSLSIGGIRADSTRTACFRGDTARVRFVLNVDTVLLRDTAAADPLSQRRATPDTVLIPIDTTALRDFFLR
jgi:tetratricopeptide (TPR) repeat protein